MSNKAKIQAKRLSYPATLAVEQPPQDELKALESAIAQIEEPPTSQESETTMTIQSEEQEQKVGEQPQAEQASTEGVEQAPVPESETPAVTPSAPETVEEVVTEPVSAASAVQVAPEAPTVQVEEQSENSEVQVEMSEEEQFIHNVRMNGTLEQQRMLAAIETFSAAMPPRMILSATKANAAQFELLQHLQWVLEKDFDKFKPAWNLLLVYFAAHHGRPTPTEYSAISEYNTARYLSSWNKGDDKAELFLGLVSVLRATRNRNTRKHDVKSIAFDRLAPGALTEKAISNLKQFYGV